MVGVRGCKQCVTCVGRIGVRRPASHHRIASRAVDGLSTRNPQTSRLPPQTEQQALKKATDQLSGAVPLPLAGPCGGMEAATEPARTSLRRVPQVVSAPRARWTKPLTVSKPRYDATALSLQADCTVRPGRLQNERPAIAPPSTRVQDVLPAALSQRVFAPAARTTQATRAYRRTPPAHRCDARCRRGPAEYGWRR